MLNKIKIALFQVLIFLSLFLLSVLAIFAGQAPVEEYSLHWLAIFIGTTFVSLLIMRKGLLLSNASALSIMSLPVFFFIFP